VERPRSAWSCTGLLRSSTLTSSSLSRSRDWPEIWRSPQSMSLKAIGPMSWIGVHGMRSFFSSLTNQLYRTMCVPLCKAIK